MLDQLSCEERGVQRILMYETPPETDFAAPHEPFIPDVFIEISELVDRKVDIMARSIGAHPRENLLARTALCGAAEGFMHLRGIEY